jgi:predicted ChrR family anti-sigma factor
MTHLDNDLTEFVLGQMEPEAQTQAEAHVAGCADCQKRVDAATEELAALALLAEPEAPSPAARDRLMEAIAFENPFAPLVSALARLGDLAEEAMRSYVKSLVDPASWLPGPAEGISIVHVDGGPSTAGAVVGFVRIAAGGEFPEHTHCGLETVIVVQGKLIDSGGGEAMPGDVVTMPADSTHTVYAGPDEDVIYFVVVFEGVNVGDDFIGPSDTRI